MQKILFVAVVETIQELLHNASVILLIEVDHAGLEQAHQVVIHVLKHKVEGSLILTELHGILLICHNFMEVDYVTMVQLPQYFDFAHSCDGKALLLVLESDLFQSYHVIGMMIPRLVDLKG